jgi:hypothetical protein
LKSVRVQHAFADQKKTTNNSYRNNQSSRIVGRSVTLTVPFRSSLFSLVLLLCWTPNVLYQVTSSLRSLPTFAN